MRLKISNLKCNPMKVSVSLTVPQFCISGTKDKTQKKV